MEEKIWQFHTSWDWLMPVVEKIENLTDGNNYLYSFEMGKDWCAITTNDFTPETIVVKSVAGNKMQCSLFHPIVQSKPTTMNTQAIEQLREALEQFAHEPYPTDIFPEVPAPTLYEIHKMLLKEFNMPIDRLSAQIGRTLRQPLLAPAKKLLASLPTAQPTEVYTKEEILKARPYTPIGERLLERLFEAIEEMRMNSVRNPEPSVATDDAISTNPDNQSLPLENNAITTG